MYQKQTTLQSFKVLQKLGEGSFASVYKVQRIDDNKIYAMKKVKIAQMKQKQRDNALNQVRVLASISHPNIVNYKEAFFDQSTESLCIVMEFADAGDVQKKINEHLKNHTFFSEQQIWQAFIQMVKGLRALHQINIFHRDIKCANVFCTTDYKYKLGDLNVSKVAKRGMARTQTGTPYYTSPEVWKDRPYDSKCDIWSFGCVIYEMASLCPPFRANNLKQLYTKIQRGIFQRIPLFYSDDLQQIVTLCLKVNPSSRPSTSQLLQNPILLRNMPNSQKYSNDINQTKKINLINTILCPRDLKSLKQALPGAKYEQPLLIKDKISDRDQNYRNSKEKEVSQSDKRSRQGSHSIRRIVSAQNLIMKPYNNIIRANQIHINKAAESPSVSRKETPIIHIKYPSSQRIPPPPINLPSQSPSRKLPVSQQRQICQHRHVQPPLVPVRESPSRPQALPLYQKYNKINVQNRQIVRNNSADALRNRRQSSKSVQHQINRNGSRVSNCSNLSNENRSVKRYDDKSRGKGSGQKGVQQGNKFAEQISNRCRNIKQRVQLIMANRDRQQRIQKLINYQQNRYGVPTSSKQRQRRQQSERSRNSSKRNSIQNKHRVQGAGYIKINNMGQRNSSKSLQRNRQIQTSKQNNPRKQPSHPYMIPAYAYQRR